MRLRADSAALARAGDDLVETADHLHALVRRAVDVLGEVAGRTGHDEVRGELERLRSTVADQQARAVAALREHGRQVSVAAQAYRATDEALARAVVVEADLP